VQQVKGGKKLLLKLRGKRVEKGFTQEEIAKKVGISTNAYNLKEQGKREFRVREINILLKLLECTYEDIFLY
jgi:DNA-binding XRE family transcriptional regulator